MKSILVDDLKYCCICGRSDPQMHHVFEGPDRKLSDKYGLILPLCLAHHTEGPDAVHINNVVNRALKMYAQSVFEHKIGTREKFMNEFRKSYI